MLLGLKDDLKAIKTELSTEEQLIEKFIKGERFIKKYKYFILALILILILWYLGIFIYDKIKQSNIKQSNILYTKLIQDPKNLKLLEELKNKNINLYTIFLMSQNSSDQSDQNETAKLQELAQNSKVNVLLKNIIALDLGNKSLFLKDYDKILQAYDLLKQNKIDDAQILLSQIKDDSQFKQIANNLKHYQGLQ